MRALVYLVFFSLFHYSYPQHPITGTILDSMAIKNSPGETFALYLPSGYSAEKQSAIVFIFDPAARGAHALKSFTAASEKYNLILVSSNNSRNTAYEENFQIADRWFKEVFSQFPIDPEQIYAAGFSGGSRLASTIGVSTGAFKGIVGCGAAFSVNPSQAPYANDHFYYAGMVGTLDMNYQEMNRAQDWLTKIGLPNRLFIFEGEHRWPDQSWITRAFDWFALQDMIRGKIPPDDNFLREYLAAELQAADVWSHTQQPVEAVELYQQVISDLGPFFDLDSIEVKIKSLSRTKSYKKNLKSREAVAGLEKDWTDKLLGRIRQEREGKELPRDYKWWKKELAQLDDKYSESSEPHLSSMGKRLQGMIFAVAIEGLESDLAEGHKNGTAYFIQLMLANWPDNPFIQYRVSKAYLRTGREDLALEHLKSAIAHGWDKQQILNDPVFHSLKNHPEYRALVSEN